MASHRQLLRELLRSGRTRTRTSRAPMIVHVRDLISNNNMSPKDAENAALFLKSHRMYQILLDRYNPLHDLTSEEHLAATARRVGLNMPLQKAPDNSNSESG